jgi:hypothetical protein
MQIAKVNLEVDVAQLLEAQSLELTKCVLKDTVHYDNRFAGA